MRSNIDSCLDDLPVREGDGDFKVADLSRVIAVNKRLVEIQNYCLSFWAFQRSLKLDFNVMNCLSGWFRELLQVVQGRDRLVNVLFGWVIIIMVDVPDGLVNVIRPRDQGVGVELLERLNAQLFLNLRFLCRSHFGHIRIQHIPFVGNIGRIVLLLLLSRGEFEGLLDAAFAVAALPRFTL